MRVHPDRQRRGFGRAILEALERRAAELGCTRLHMERTTAQEAAQRLYRARGYRETGRAMHGGFETVRFEKRLGA